MNNLTDDEKKYNNLLQIFSPQFEEDNIAAYVKCGEMVKTVSYIQMRNHLYGNIQRLNQYDWSNKNIALIGMFGYGWILNFFTILASGGTAVLIDGNLSSEKISQLISLSGAEYTVVSSKCRYESPVPGIIYSNDPDQYGLDGAVLTEKENIDQIDPRKPAVIAFTSGTTGAEKAVVLTHENICADIYGCRHLLKDLLKPDLKVLPLLPFYHMFGLTAGLLLPLTYRMSVVFIDSLKYTASMIQKTSPDILVAVPLILETLTGRISRIAAGKEGLKPEAVKGFFGNKLKYIVSGGALLRDELYTFITDFGIELLNGYGMTECSPIISVNPSGASKNGTVGLPLDRESVQVRIEDGELQVKGRIIMKEYFRNPEASADLFQDGWLKTGDLGVIDDEGYIHITGRKKDLIILSDGNNVSPEELENMLMVSPMIKSVMVCEEHQASHSCLAAHIYLEEDLSGDREDIKNEVELFIKEVNKKNPAYKRIHRIYYTDRDFEKNSLGKIKRFKVKF